jgi:hypothetical protein
VICFGLVVGTAVNAEAQLDCSFTIHLDDAVSVGSLQYDVDYSGTGGALNGSGGSVECTDLTGSIATFFDDDAGMLDAAYLSFVGFNGPTDLATCNMTAATVPNPIDFAATVTDGSDPFTTPFNPLPSASVTNISCTGGTTTTMGGSTTTTTTTTSTTSTTFPGSPFCWVRVSMTTNEALGSLQYDLGYAGVNGEFEGSSNGVTCENLVAGTISTMADNDVDNVGVAIISLSAFAGPTDVTRCVWLPYGADPVTNDFTITVVDASDTGAQPVVPLPVLDISDISCFAGPTTTTTSTTSTTLAPYCGDGTIDTGEECDDAGGNSDTTPDACRTDCSLPWCGDEVIDTGEGCDDVGGNSDTASDACRTDCTPANCGDGVIDSGEECDLGPLNDPSGVTGCFDDCTEMMICGDANANMIVTASDAQQVLQAGVGLSVACPLKRCDASQDGNITSGDAARVLSGAVGLLSLNCDQP